MSEREHEHQDTPFPDSTGDRVEGMFDETKGRGKSAAGELTGDERMQREGKADQFAGKATQGLADAKDSVNDAVRSAKDR